MGAERAVAGDLCDAALDGNRSRKLTRVHLNGALPTLQLRHIECAHGEHPALDDPLAADP